MDASYRVCPRCGAEYVPSVGRCLDCGVDLVREGEAAPPVEPETDLPPAAELRLVRPAELAWAQDLAAALIEQGVPCRLEILPPGPGDAARGFGARYGVFVRPEDSARAAAVDAAHARTQLPDLEGVEPVAAGDEGCPACGASVSSDVEECPECGLVFAPHE